MPDPEIPGIQATLTNSDREGNGLVPVGPRMPLETFCKPAETVPLETTHSVCMGEVTFPVAKDDSEPVNEATLDIKKPEDTTIDDFTLKTSEEEEKPVVTACNHYFHESCLDAWVNDSAMRTANQCPSCRTQLCDGRPRVPLADIQGEDMAIDPDVECLVMTMALEEGINEEVPALTSPPAYTVLDEMPAPVVTPVPDATSARWTIGRARKSLSRARASEDYLLPRYVHGHL